MKISKKKFDALQYQIAKQACVIGLLEREISSREQQHAKNIECLKREHAINDVLAKFGRK